jgi:hypothetical protein
MDLTKENIEYIDRLSYEQLLSWWRFAPIGDPWFQGGTGEYWANRMAELRNEPGGYERHIIASKTIGWEKR